LEEKGIPIDMIGGTSIGSFVGGLYACEQSIEKVDPIARRWAEQGSSLWFYLMGTHISPSLSSFFFDQFPPCRSNFSHHLVLQWIQLHESTSQSFWNEED
jgi:predicted acylesterase/phospholipase RssA